MARYVSRIVLSLLLMLSLFGCAGMRWTALPSGRSFSLRVFYNQLFVSSKADSLVDPAVSDVTVEVRDAQGRPVDGVEVEFFANGLGGESSQITPRRAVTRQGVAKARFQPNQIGIFFVGARVEQQTREVEVYANDRFLCCGCQVWPPGDRCEFPGGADLHIPEESFRDTHLGGM